jgi:hypothetical protein
VTPFIMMPIRFSFIALSMKQSPFQLFSNRPGQKLA